MANGSASRTFGTEEFSGRTDSSEGSELTGLAFAQWRRQEEMQEAASESRSAFDEILRRGAQRMLVHAIQVEVDEYVEAHRELTGPDGRRLVVRNGHMPTRTLQTPVGDVELTRQRVHDRRPGHKFTSAVLPAYMRRSPSIAALIPVLYLKGVSTNDFVEALAAILGEQARGLSASTICRLKEAWEKEYEEWNGRDLSGKRYVYWWADGIYLRVRLSDEKPCVLVIMGALEDGTKELLAVYDGERESKLSWSEVLRDLKNRGLGQAPALAVGDGALGFWAALEEEFPQTREQRCWVHKTANVLDKLPKKLQASAKAMLHDIYMAPTKAAARQAYRRFMELFGPKYPKAAECLRKDEDVLFTFYDFPAEHWQSIRTTNPIESTFATVRHRTRQTKGAGSRTAALAMVYKLAREAEKGWNRLRGYRLIMKVIQGVKFQDGVEVNAA